MNNDELILKELREIKDRLSKLERLSDPIGPFGPYTPSQPYNPGPYTPSQPYNPISKVNHCSTCGIKFEGMMGYVCNRGDCPSGLGPVMC